MRDSHSPPLYFPYIIKGALDIWKDKVFSKKTLEELELKTLASEFLDLYEQLQQSIDKEQSKADFINFFDSILSEKNLEPLKAIDDLIPEKISFIHFALKVGCTPIATKFFLAGFKTTPMQVHTKTLQSYIKTFFTGYEKPSYLHLLIKVFGIEAIEEVNPRILSEIALKQPNMVRQVASILIAYGYDLQMPGGIGVYNTALTSALGGYLSEINDLDVKRKKNAREMILRGARFDVSYYADDTTKTLKGTILAPFVKNRNATLVMDFLCPLIFAKYAAMSNKLRLEDKNLTIPQAIKKAVDYGYKVAPNEQWVVACYLTGSTNHLAFAEDSFQSRYFHLMLDRNKYFLDSSIIEIEDMRECISEFFWQNTHFSLVSKGFKTTFIHPDGKDAWPLIWTFSSGITEEARALILDIPKTVNVSLKDKKLFKEEVLYESIKALFYQRLDQDKGLNI